jgi:hypothetical protein
MSPILLGSATPASISPSLIWDRDSLHLRAKTESTHKDNIMGSQYPLGHAVAFLTLMHAKEI